MTSTFQDPSAAIAQRIKQERDARNWSLAELAERSGVSKAMISKIERGEASPTATILGRLSGAFGQQLSTLLASAEQSSDRLLRHEDQPVWTDPETGYVRRRLSPPNGGILELLRIDLPPNARVSYPPDAFTFQHQQMWVLRGVLVFQEGAETHTLKAGDCLQLGRPMACTFANPGVQPCSYLIALAKR
jgi:transcriptional regulator with XRE-family HTH domain